LKRLRPADALPIRAHVLENPNADEGDPGGSAAIEAARTGQTEMITTQWWAANALAHLIRPL
jgi:hypothetical protein